MISNKASDKGFVISRRDFTETHIQIATLTEHVDVTVLFCRTGLLSWSWTWMRSVTVETS